MNNYETEECVNEIMNERKSIINSKFLNIMKDYDLKISKKEKFSLKIPFINFLVSSKIKKRIDRYISNKNNDIYAQNILQHIDFDDYKLSFYTIICSVFSTVLTLSFPIFALPFSPFLLLLYIVSISFFLVSLGNAKNMIKIIEEYDQKVERMIEQSVMQETLSQDDFDKLKECCSHALMKKILIDSNFNINYNSIEEIIPILKKLEKDKQAEMVAEKILKCEDIVFQ